MRKFLKNQKGFTLIELMMVIAVIGILAAVLIPKIGSTKDNAKLSGVESNARQVQATVEALIERNKHNSGALQAAIVDSINSEGTNAAAADVGDMVNPFNSNSYGADDADDADNAVVVLVGGSVDDPSPGQIGVIIAVHGATTNVDDVVITPYDNAGDAMNTITVRP